MEKIIFVTGNKGKQENANRNLKKYNLEVTCLDLDIIEPNVNDIEYIAASKVLQAYKMVNKPCVSLDAGFYIPNFPNQPNFPGAFPKRELLDKIGINGLLDIMKDTKNRECYFKECLAYYDGSDIKYFYGFSEGSLSLKKMGIDQSNKWSDLWYIFIPKNCTKTLAEMTEEERRERPDEHTNSFDEFGRWYEGKIKQYKKL